ncbi:hypothetical protein LEP1GSC047_4409 [Leptospira inadai serovar Lyme str. 10]|uniref:Uncharacterized protein n=1 Tax=Leptospira inadai serovar Lyme str. 10 TaxID=1049790 RepID=V6HXR0_9LEPT|nr:hypothetical protein LEP1GSC047_4409 [Leptospira inadai serovar Lyme str. 10]
MIISRYTSLGSEKPTALLPRNFFLGRGTGAGLDERRRRPTLFLFLFPYHQTTIAAIRGFLVGMEKDSRRGSIRYSRFRKVPNYLSN